MRPIGGYFELELVDGGNRLHEAATFKSGRAALKFLLLLVRPKKVYLPFYTCDALLQPLAEANIPYQFYAIDINFDPVQLPEPGAHEYVLYINYFDLKRETVAQLSDRYGTQLIVDCSQAFFMQANGKSWFFNSCRKFFGVPDGAYLMPPDNHLIETETERNENYIVQHLIKRMEGKIKEGFGFYKENEARCDSEIKSMSMITERLLSHVNYAEVMEKRTGNFAAVHSFLGKYNLLSLPQKINGVPMVYPLLLQRKADHKKLWAKELFVAIYWPDILKRKTKDFSTEVQLTENLIPVPVDHRYTKEDMAYIAEIIQEQC